EESVLADQRVDERHRNRERQQIAEGVADDRAYRDEKRQKADRGPAHEGELIGKLRQRGGDEQERRRIMPGEVADEILAKFGDLDLLLDVPVIGLRRETIEHQAA